MKFNSKFTMQNSKLSSERGDEMESHIAVFKGKEIRKTIHNNELSEGLVQIVPTLLRQQGFMWRRGIESLK
jgi:hypothetical protein